MRVIYVVAFVIIYLELFSVPFSFMTLGLAGNALDFTSIIIDAYSSYNLLFSINAQEKNIEKFGLINSTTIDLVRTIFGFEEKAAIENDGIDEVKNGKQNEVDGEEVNEPEEPTYNELDLRLEELIAQTSDEGLKNVYEYIANKKPTNKNKYTSYFKDKNLIFILAEGFNSIAVDENLTPSIRRKQKIYHIARQLKLI